MLKYFFTLILFGLLLPAFSQPKILVFSKTNGFRHTSIPMGIQMITNLAAANNFTADFSEDEIVFRKANLVQYDAIVFLSTNYRSGHYLDSIGEDAIEEFVQSGKGFASIHGSIPLAGSLEETIWPWYVMMVGTRFRVHTANGTQGTLDVEDTTHLAGKGLPLRWTRNEEWYSFHNNPRDSVNVILSLDETSLAIGGANMGGDHPISWNRDFQGGRFWYTAIGHDSSAYLEPLVQQHMLGGLEYVMSRSTPIGNKLISFSINDSKKVLMFNHLPHINQFNIIRNILGQKNPSYFSNSQMKNAPGVYIIEPVKINP